MNPFLPQCWTFIEPPNKRVVSNYIVYLKQATLDLHSPLINLFFKSSTCQSVIFIYKYENPNQLPGQTYIPTTTNVGTYTLSIT